MPPYLAGREAERQEFEGLLDQTPILKNLILTGLRGIGKSVLLETFKPLAIEAGWLWVGTDMSEAASVSEETLAIRLVTDVALVTSSFSGGARRGVGFSSTTEPIPLSFEILSGLYASTPGLVRDKVQEVLEFAIAATLQQGFRGVVFAYDEAQNISESEARHEFPVALILDVFQSIQAKQLPCLLILSGLPALRPKLLDARTFAERMFHTMRLPTLTTAQSEEAITRPLEHPNARLRLDDRSIETICEQAAGYPYFLQYICRDVYDLFLQQLTAGLPRQVPVDVILKKLDADFYTARWERATDRQRELLAVTASLSQDGEFSSSEIVAASQALQRPFTTTSVNQLLAGLVNSDLVYKTGHGKYAFAVPLFDRFLLRQSR
jgi:hypothetical protein